MRLLYFDPALKSHAGHNATYCDAITHGFKSIGIETLIFGSNHVDNDLQQSMQVSPFFKASPFDQPSSDPLCGGLLNYFQVSKEIAQDLIHLDNLLPNDLMYFVAATPAALMGVMRYVEKMGSVAPKLIIDLVDKADVTRSTNNKNEFILTANSINPSLWRYTVSDKKIDSKKIQLISYEKIFADIYSALLNLPVNKIPHPISPLPKKTTINPKLVLGFLGFQSLPKGIKLIPGIVQRILSLANGPSILVHDCSNHQGPEIQFLKNLSLHNRPLILDLSRKNKEGWAETLLSCDLVIAPYDAKVYGSCGSGIAHECLANGIPMITTANTSAADLLRELNLDDLVVEEYSENAFFEKVKYFLINSHSIKKRFVDAQLIWSARNNSVLSTQSILKLYQGMA